MKAVAVAVAMEKELMEAVDSICDNSVCDSSGGITLRAAEVSIGGGGGG